MTWLVYIDKETNSAMYIIVYTEMCNFEILRKSS